MGNDSVISIKSPVTNDLQALFKSGAEKLLAQAIMAEIGMPQDQFSEMEVNGKQALVRFCMSR